MGKVINFESFVGAFKSTKDFYAVNRELREYVNRLSLTEAEQSELAEIIIRQLDAFAELILSQLKHASEKDGGNLAYTIRINPKQEAGDSKKTEEGN